MLVYERRNAAQNGEEGLTYGLVDLNGLRGDGIDEFLHAGHDVFLYGLDHLSELHLNRFQYFLQYRVYGAQQLRGRLARGSENGSPVQKRPTVKINW